VRAQRIAARPDYGKRFLSLRCACRNRCPRVLRHAGCADRSLRGGLQHLWAR